MIQSIVHRWPLLSPIFRVAYEFRVEKLVIFWGYPQIDPIFYFFIRPEELVSQAVCHWSKQVIVRGSNVWRIRRVG